MHEHKIVESDKGRKKRGGNLLEGGRGMGGMKLGEEQRGHSEGEETFHGRLWRVCQGVK